MFVSRYEFFRFLFSSITRLPKIIRNKKTKKKRYRRFRAIFVPLLFSVVSSDFYRRRSFDIIFSTSRIRCTPTSRFFSRKTRGFRNDYYYYYCRSATDENCLKIVCLRRKKTGIVRKTVVDPLSYTSAGVFHFDFNFFFLFLRTTRWK